MPKILILSLILVASCSTSKKSPPVAPGQEAPQEFAMGEVILANQLLTSIFDGEMAYLSCVPDHDEAELLLRTLNPRMEVAQDDLEAMLDNPKDVSHLVKTCHSNCTCGYLDELLREHQVRLSRNEQKLLASKNAKKEVNRCMSYVQNTFCQSELYKTLSKEKADFSFDEEAP